MKKKTAVDWLIEQIGLTDFPMTLAHQAKAMEREQIEGAFNRGGMDGRYLERGIDKDFKNPHEYYTQTYE